LIIARNICIVPQAYAYVVERFGIFDAVWNAGFHFKIPIISRIAKKVSLKEQVVDFPPQPVITRDNVTMQIDTVVFFQVTDPKLYAYGVESPMDAIENLTATTLRNIIGELELDESLTSRELINSKIRLVLDEATDPWGIKINRVEVKNITPPRDIQTAMEKQMRAERERREAILIAEGEKKSQVLIAEGQKEAAILQAEAAKQAAILNAQGDKESLVLRATAEKEAAIARAEGQAEALRLVYEAQGKAINYINAANPNDAYVQLEGLKALKDLSNGTATKIIVPSNLQGLAGTLTSAAEILKEDK
jgi:regulator of protease activity HflC (stomatin/prohibitin superfamily)